MHKKLIGEIFADNRESRTTSIAYNPGMNGSKIDKDNAIMPSVHGVNESVRGEKRN